MSGILDTHAADTMNQMPMAMMLMPCVVSCSGGTRYRCRVWHLLEVTGIYAADTMNQIPMAMMLMPFPCPVVTVTDAHGTDTMNQMPMELMPMQSIPMPCVASSGVLMMKFNP